MKYVNGEVPDDAIYVELPDEDWRRETDEYTPFSQLSDEEAALKAREYELKLFDLYLQRVKNADFDASEAESLDNQDDVVRDTLGKGVQDAHVVKQALSNTD